MKSFANMMALSMAAAAASLPSDTYLLIPSRTLFHRIENLHLGQRNQRKARKARRQRWAVGDRRAFKA